MSDRMQHHTLLVHPQFQELSTFVASIPSRMERGEGEVIYKGRNELRKMEYQGRWYVVKSFRKPHLLNQLVYGIGLRASKAKRAYLNGCALLDIGVPNPQPIGYIEVRPFVLLSQSYFVSALSDCPYTWKDITDGTLPCTEAVCREVGRITALLHNHQLALKDHSRGNILFKVVKDKVQLQLVDLNRMYHGKIDMQRGCKNFDRLPATPQMQRWMAEAYAAERGMDVAQCYALICAFRKKQEGKY